MVFYRKYRPQQIDDLDNAQLRETLNAVLVGETAHAFLFTGPKGLGKTSTARIIAKAVNCENPKGVEPCNVCDQCLSITEGTNMDILEIDAASNRGIDEIRDLKEKIRLAPLSAKKKVYIIDEVHMLTTEAFNALLKTLEEPPEHAMFMLCTTEPHKVPATILSRCFHVAFQPAGEDELLRSFKRIVKGENLTIADDALAMIAQLAEGGFRDGAKILEEIVSLAAGKEVTKAFVEEKYQVSSIKSHVEGMIDALSKRETNTGLQIIAQLKEQGVDLKYFLQQLMEELHHMLLVNAGVHKAGKTPLLTLTKIRDLFVLFSKASAEMKHAVLPQLPLELAVIEYCVIPSAVEAPPQSGKYSWGESYTTSRIKKSEVGDPPQEYYPLQGGASTRSSVGMTKAPVVEEDPEVTVTTLRKQVDDITKQKALYGEEKKEPVAKKEEVVSDVDLMHTNPDGEVTPEWLAALWKAMIGDMKSYNHTVAGVLRGCKIKHFDRKTLIIETAYQFHKEKLDEAKTRDALHKICKTLTGKDVSVKIELKA